MAKIKKEGKKNILGQILNSMAHSVLFQLRPASSGLEDYVQIIVFVDFDLVLGCSVNSHCHLLIPRSYS